MTTMENANIGNPWKGLSSYTYQDADLFYGREQELTDITSVIKQNVFTTLYGISGAGKTSIINAGLFPLLEKQSFLPIYIRFDHDVGHVPYDMQIIKAVNCALDSIEAESEDIVGHEIEAEMDRLWLYFHSHRFWTKDNHVISPIIFIDQFEEIFTKNDDPENIWSFFNIIDSLQYITPTDRIILAMEKTDQYVSFGEEQNFRIVFSMREDFLPRLEDYSYNIPALRKNRIGLKPLNGLQALEVILKPRPEMVTREVALQIISKVTGMEIKDNERKLEATSVDTSILSLFCTELYNYAMEGNNGIISTQLVNLYGGNILEWFYDRNMQMLPKNTYVYLEDQLLTLSGFRNSVALENLLDNGVKMNLLERLAENRIVRIEDVNHSLRVEFTHDVLCKIAKARRDEREKINRMKSEKSARRAFTIDSVIIFGALTLGLTFIYSKSYRIFNAILFSFAPIVTYLYLIIAQRSVADRNLSNTIWGIAGWIIAGWIIIAVGRDLEIGDCYAAAMICFFLFSLLLLPYALWMRSAMQHRFKLFKSLKWFVLAYGLFIAFQSGLIGLWVGRYRDDYGRLPLFMLPSILMVLSPLYGLYQMVKKKTYTALACYIGIFSLIIPGIIGLMYIPLLDNKEKYYDKDLSSFFTMLCTVGCTMGALALFYAVQYMKLPKQQGFVTYHDNLMNFQAFKKYKSFKPRLITIASCFVLLMMRVISTHYIDFIPFVTLPLACILALQVGCVESKMTTPKTAWSLKVIIPLVILAESIVLCQYTMGWAKQPTVFVCSLLITALVFGWLTYKEDIRRRKLFAASIFVLSCLTGFLLPVFCLGYNIYNPSLASVARVRDGAIASDARNVYFMTIKNDDGKLGVMDHSEILVAPEYDSLKKTCLINEKLVKAIYPYRYLAMYIFDIDYRGCDFDYIDGDNPFALLLAFTGMKNDTIETTTLNHFLNFENKYGKSFVEDWQYAYKYDLSKYYFDWKYDWHDEALSRLLLSTNNRCISDEGRKTAIIRLFIRYLANECSIEDDDYYLKENKIEVDGHANDTTKTLIKCYNEVTLEPLLKKSNYLTLEQLYRTSMDAHYLFAFDKSGTLEDIILGKLWDKVKKGDTNVPPSKFEEGRAFLYLLSGNKASAEKIARNCLASDPDNVFSLSNLCVILYCGGKISEMDEILHKNKTFLTQHPKNLIIFYGNLSTKIASMRKLDVIKDNDELIDHIIDMIPANDDILRMVKENDDKVLNKMVYEFAKMPNFDLAMGCIEKAIFLSPLKANYYDSRGEILLKQGKEQEAKQMWEKVIKLDPDFLSNYERGSELYLQLLTKGLITDKEEQPDGVVDENI